MKSDQIQDSTGKLTPRQHEFFSSLLRLYEAKGHAVSYKDVAAVMKVSKWTAYDVLRGLADRGIVHAEYALTPGKGRSQVLYSPVASSAAGVSAEANVNERTALLWLRKTAEKYAKYGVAESISLAARSVREEKNAFRVALRVSLMIVLFASFFSVDMDQLVHTRALVASGVSADTILGLLGEIMFSLLQDEAWIMGHLSLPQKALQEFAEVQKSFMASVVQLSGLEKRLMVSAVGQALA